MRDFIVIIGQIISAEDYADRFNINVYKVKGASKEEVKSKIKSRTEFWEGLHVDVMILNIIDMEETAEEKRREVEFLGNYWMLPKSTK